MIAAIRRLGATVSVLFALAALAAPASGAGGDPLFVFVPTGGSYFEGPCGLGVDSSGRFYLADYYHHAIDLYSGNADYAHSPNDGSTGFIAKLANVDPLDGPCGLALNSSNALYVNDFDRNVARYGAYPFFGTASLLAGAGVDSTHPTGVAVDPATGDVYVDDRTYVAVYDSSGAPIMNGAEPLRIGLDPLADYYGLAFSAGRLFLADAATETVKFFEPATDTVNPLLTIPGPPGGFTSLRDSALAVDGASGVLYVVDDLQPGDLAEQPRAQVDLFSSIGAYLGVLKYQIVDALPPGLAVDPSGGRVYVTSGNTDQAGIYAYAAGSQVPASQPPSAGLTLSVLGTGAGAVTSSLGGIDCATACSVQIRAGAALALSATPGPGSTFAGWSGGGCSGTGACTLQMDRATSLSAEFAASPGALPDRQPSEGVSSSPPPTATAKPQGDRRGHRHRRHRHRRHRHRPASLGGGM
jgi:DNA-binding beta-propeller fold protein YncE